MKCVCTFEFTVDGDIPSDDTIAEAFLQKFDFGVITSEDYDGTEAWAILLDSCTAEVQK